MTMCSVLVTFSSFLARFMSNKSTSWNILVLILLQSFFKAVILLLNSQQEIFHAFSGHEEVQQ